MADISNVTVGDIKEISDSLDALSCKKGPTSTPSFLWFANDISDSAHLDTRALLEFLDRLMHSTGLGICATG